MLRTVGDHLRQRRLELGLLQREVAERLGADECTVNRTSPALRFLPRIIDVLGFDPSAPSASLGEHLKAARRRLGCPQERFARLLGIDPSTLSLWERNLRTPRGRYAQLADPFLGSSDP